MKIPRFLRKGDTIGVTAPSAGAAEPLDKVRFDSARRNLEDRGYRIRYTPNVFTDDDGRSSPAEQRARELESLIADESVSCIMSASGGDHLNEIFDHLDMSGIADHPKWMQGYSDNTDILLMATVDYDVMSIYCGNYGDFGMDPWHESIGENLEILEGRRSTQGSYPLHATGFNERVTGLEPPDYTEKTIWISEDSSFRGRLIGGCSDKLREIVGSDRDHVSDFVDRYSEDGMIWYMETFVSTHDGIIEDLRSMRDAGWFGSVRGFVFGRPIFYETSDYNESVLSVIGDLNVPVVFDADVGHLAPRMAFINGAIAEVTVRCGKATVCYPELRTQR